MLIKGMTAPEIRVLQEFRRMGKDALGVDAIKAIKHPSGGGEAPANALVAKGFLASATDGFTLTEKAREFLAYDPKPEFEEAGTAAEVPEEG